MTGTTLAAVSRQQHTAYEYDGLYRLISVTAPSGVTQYAYDPVGNRRTRQLGGNAPTTSTYDNADRITGVGGLGYSVDANGNLMARGTDTFSYDQANRLKAVDLTGTTNDASYAYDGDGKRFSATINGTTTRSVYDEQAPLPLLLDDGTHRYVWGANGLAYTVDGANAALVYHADGLGSVRALTNTSATPQVVQTYQSDEFGVPTVTAGSVSQPMQYTGEQRDAETGFVYLRARMYDPTAGRFLQSDPRQTVRCDAKEPAGLNRYTYVENNPTDRTDASGTTSSRVTEGIAAPDPGCGTIVGILGVQVCIPLQNPFESQLPRKRTKACDDACEEERKKCIREAAEEGLTYSWEHECNDGHAHCVSNFGRGKFRNPAWRRRSKGRDFEQVCQ